MAESATPSRSRVRRATRISQRLAAARERNAVQLARQREQETRVEAALAEFFGADEQIAAAQADTQRKIEPHERAIVQLREQLGETVSGAEAAQAQAALAIHESDRTVEQVGELLGLGEKAARRLIVAGRDAAERDDAPDEAEPAAADPGPGRNDGSSRAESAEEPSADSSWASGDLSGEHPVRASAADGVAGSRADTTSG